MLINDAHVWIGKFASEEALDEYVEEEFSVNEDDEEPPINRFVADQGKTFYDSDLCYAQFHEQAGPAELIDGWGFPKTSMAELIESIEPMNIENGNTCFIADNGEFATPKSASGPGYQIWYVGQFDGCGF